MSDPERRVDTNPEPIAQTMKRPTTKILLTLTAAAALAGLSACSDQDEHHSDGMHDTHDAGMHEEHSAEQQHEDADMHHDSDHAASNSATDRGTEVHHASTEAEKPADARTVEIVATDYAFDPATVTAEPGEKLYIKLVNQGEAVHMWQIEGMPETHVHTNPGVTASKVITAPEKSGSYQVICQTPGHEERGMVGTLKVRD